MDRNRPPVRARESRERSCDITSQFGSISPPTAGRRRHGAGDRDAERALNFSADGQTGDSDHCSLNKPMAKVSDDDSAVEALKEIS